MESAEGATLRRPIFVTDPCRPETSDRVPSVRCHSHHQNETIFGKADQKMSSSSENEEGTYGLKIPSFGFWKVRKVLKGWGKVDGFRGEVFRKVWRLLGIAGKHARFPDMLGICLAIHCMFHSNIKSPPLE